MATVEPTATAAAAPAVEVAVAAPAAAADGVKSKLLQQVEYYFSDANFRRDKFLRSKAAEDADGFVGLEVLTTFNRIKALTTDPRALADALEDSEVVELSEDRLAVRRVKPLPEVDDSEVRSVYAKGPFPTDATLEDLQAWAAAWGSVARVVMRKTRNKEKTFKGSIIVEFAQLDFANACVAAASAGAAAYAGTPVLRVEALKEYYARKKVEREARKAKKATSAGAGGAKAGGAGGGVGAEAGAEVRKRSARDAPEVAEDDDDAPPAGAEEKKPRAFEKKLTPNVILRIEQIGNGASIETLQVSLP